MSRSAGRLPRKRERDKRRVYQLILPLVSLVVWLMVVFNLYFRLLADFYVVVLVLTGVTVTLLAVLAFRREVRLQLIEATLLLATIVVHALVLWWSLYVEQSGPLSPPAVAVFIWLPGTYLILFLALPDRIALRYAVAVQLFVMALTFQQLTDHFGPGDGGQTVFVLIQVYLSHAVLITALYFISTFQRRFQHMEATANTMRRLANTDALTGLGNRRQLEQVLDDEVRRAERYDRPLSVIVSDIDDFKKLNDRYGHPAGDKILIELGNRLRHSVRSADYVGRWGGEEFIIVTPETRLDDAIKLAEVVRGHVADGPIGDDHSVTLSFGVAGYCAGDSAADLLDRSDTALYLAKRQGKNRVRSERDIDREAGGV